MFETKFLNLGKKVAKKAIAVVIQLENVTQGDILYRIRSNRLESFLITWLSAPINEVTNAGNINNPNTAIKHRNVKK
jgi:hypothetical protein